MYGFMDVVCIGEGTSPPYLLSVFFQLIQLTFPAIPSAPQPHFLPLGAFRSLLVPLPSLLLQAFYRPHLLTLEKYLLKYLGLGSR